MRPIARRVSRRSRANVFHSAVADRVVIACGSALPPQDTISREEGRQLCAQLPRIYLCIFSKFFGHFHQVDHRFRLHLAHHVSTLNFDGDFGGAQFRRNFLVELSFEDEP
jgi:hypothetical protein